MKITKQDLILRIINAIMLGALVLLIVFPFWDIILKSFMTDAEIGATPFVLWPKIWQLDGYVEIFTNPTYNIGRAFLVSVFITFVTTLYQLSITTCLAYTLSRKNLPGKKIIMTFFLITMYFGGGLIPYYILINSLGFMNKVSVMIVPGFMNLFNVLVMRSFFLGIPKELEEAVKIDGGSDAMVFLKIVLPISKAVLATIALFIAVGVWNNWYSAMLFMPTNARMRPLAYSLMIITELASGTNTSIDGNITVVGKSIQYATIVVTIIPVMAAYPFLQKHFVKGVLIGSIKE